MVRSNNKWTERKYEEKRTHIINYFETEMELDQRERVTTTQIKKPTFAPFFINQMVTFKWNGGEKVQKKSSKPQKYTV